jgi:hypothetical protein
MVAPRLTGSVYVNMWSCVSQNTFVHLCFLIIIQIKFKRKERQTSRSFLQEHSLFEKAQFVPCNNFDIVAWHCGIRTHDHLPPEASTFI